MMIAILRRKPNAENSHVRFVEGEAAPTKPSRGFLFCKFTTLTLVAAGLVSVCNCKTANAEGGLALASGGKTPYMLVTADTLQKGERFVLDDFKALFKEATGAEITEVKRPQAPAAKRIFFGVAPEDLDKNMLADQEYVVMRREDDIYLVGGGYNGNRFAVYDFLEYSLGFRFFDAQGGLRVPALAQGQEVNVVEKHRRPSFLYRYMNGGTGYYNRPIASVFIYRNGQNSFVSADATYDKIEMTPDDFRMVGSHAHTLPMYIPPFRKNPTFKFIKDSEKEDLFKIHPEYFTASGDGKRTPNHQVCYAQKGLRDLLKNRILENMRLHPYGNIYDFSASDTPGPYCSCPQCKNFTETYGALGGPVFDFVLKEGAEICEKYPTNRLMCLIYRKDQTQHPPKGVTKFPPNFLPDFAPIDDNFARDWTDPTNAETYEDLKTWCKLSNEVIVWYYPNPYTCFVTPPLGNVSRIANDVKLMHKAGVKGHLMEHNVGVGLLLGFTELQSYIIIHLMRDVDLDWHALADEFIEYQYGPAAAVFKAYWQELETVTAETPLQMSWCASPASYLHLTPERLLRWEDDFDKMEDLVKDDPKRLFNVQRVRANLDYGLMTRYVDVRKTGGGRLKPYAFYKSRALATVERAVKAFATGRIASLGKEKLRSFRESADYFETQALESKIPLPKDLFGNVPEDQLYVFVPRVAGHRLLEDKDAAFGVAAWYDNNGRGGVGLPFCADFADHTKVPPAHFTRNIGRITKATIGPRGQYKFYYCGRHVVSPDCTFRMGASDRWDIKASVGTTWRFGSYNRVKFYASLKFEGEAFYAEDAGKPNRVFCDRVVAMPDEEH